MRSSAVTIWLKLAKPARKLKNAADEVAQGNLRQQRRTDQHGDNQQ